MKKYTLIAKNRKNLTQYRKNVEENKLDEMKKELFALGAVEIQVLEQNKNGFDKLIDTITIEIL